jgi:hypothetical protein
MNGMVDGVMNGMMVPMVHRVMDWMVYRMVHLRRDESCHT